jgi:hypothetical protein
MNALAAAMVASVTLATAVRPLIRSDCDAAGDIAGFVGGVPCETSDLSGRVLFSGLAVPGATVTARRGDRLVTTLTDDEGAFRFAGLDEGAWTIRVEMRGFVAMSRDITVPFTERPLTLTLTMQPYDGIVGPRPPTAMEPPAGAAAAVTATLTAPSPDAPDIINGSVVNGAASVFAQPRAFGNNRPGQGALYTGGITSVLGNSAWNATPFSFGGSTTPAPSYGDVQLGFILAGPMKIPRLVTNGPQVTVGYQHGVLHHATTQSALMPTAAQRAGDLSGTSLALRDPLTGLPFPGNMIPSGRITSQSAALLAYYPLPDASTSSGANYQKPVVTATTQDSVQFAVSKNVTRRTTIGGLFEFQRTLTNSVSLFGFADRSRQSSLNAAVTWTRRFSTRLQLRAKYQFTRAGTTSAPYFASRANVSGDAGIAGNNQDAVNWGPPALLFPDITGLHDADYQHSLAYAHVGGVEANLKRGRHNITMGGDARWNEFNVSSQPDPRGTLAFTGAATGSAFGDFLLGLPSTSSIAFGDTNLRLRGAAYDAYLNDDVRIGTGLTTNVGLRWEYEAPFTEAAGRLADLDVSTGFAAIAPVVATHPVGSVTGTAYPRSLLRPDKRTVEPRVATSWRPILGSSLVIRASYGLYRNLGVYQPLALLLAQQPPFSRTVSVQNGPLTPLTLANPFPSSLPGVSNTLGIDPKFRPGYVHAWQVQVQRDLPASLTVLAVYDGAKGTHLMQAVLPNTYPTGAANPCPSCPAGFVYLTSNGDSVRNAGQFTLRRRLHAGLMASLQYTIAKSTDDAATFSNTSVSPQALAVAQDWLNPSAERGPSSFDQRHLVSVQFQYTTGVGVPGGTLLDGVWGTLFKDWTITSQVSDGSGLPLTPVSFTAIAGTGFVGVRPMLTGAPIRPTTPGAYANPAAFAAPSPGTWGDAGRNSIRGPRQFSLDMSIARVFRLHGRLNLEWRVAVTNILNRVTFATIGTVISSPQFGLPTLANPMRRIQVTARLRF